MGHWLPKVSARSDVKPEALIMVHKSLVKLPEYVTEALWSGSAGVSVRADFPWDDEETGGQNYHGQSWHECGGYWNGSWAIVNAGWCRSQAEMDAVVHHEFGHALSEVVLEAPHRRPEFREAWSEGRRTIKERWPADYEARERMGVFCLHWTRGVQEVWAEAFAWIQRSRATTHPAFGEVFARCIALVKDDLRTLEPA